MGTTASAIAFSNSVDLDPSRLLSLGTILLVIALATGPVYLAEVTIKQLEVCLLNTTEARTFRIPPRQEEVILILHASGRTQPPSSSIAPPFFVDLLPSPARLHFRRVRT